MRDLVVGIGDAKTTTGDGEIVTYALGSCVGVCIYDITNGIGGMLHAMLPDSNRAENITNEYKYVDTGIEALYKKLCYLGCDGKHFRAKIVGGAKMFEYNTTTTGLDIGTENVLQTRKYLQKYGIPISREVTGGEVGRTIHFCPFNGVVSIYSTDGRMEEI